MTVLRLFQKQLERFFPFQCQLCGELTGIRLEVCQSCKEDLPWLVNPCELCGRPLSLSNDSVCGHCLAQPPVYSKAIPMFHYSGDVKNRVVGMKFHRSTAAIRLLGDLLAEHIRHGGLPDSLLMPVPLHPHRMRQRGYNQSAELVKHIAKNLSWPADLYSLRKQRHTEPQVGLSGVLRKRNLKGAFKVSKDLGGQSVLLIDDVMTTDSTCNECASVLLKAGAEAVYVAAVARTLK